MCEPYRPVVEVKTSNGLTILKAEVWTLVFYDLVLRRGFKGDLQVFIDNHQVDPPEAIEDDD